MPRYRLSVLVHAAALGGASGAAILVAFAAWSWVGEALANLPLHLTLGSATVALLAAMLPLPWLRRLGLVLIAVALTAFHALPLLPYIASPPPAALRAGPDGVALRLLVANLRSWSADLPALERMLRDSRIDIALLTEITPNQQQTYKSVADILPHQFGTPFERDNTFALHILARRPMDVALHHPVPFDHPVLQARFCGAVEKCLTILSVHAPRPGPDGRALRNKVLQEIVAQTRQAMARGDHVIAAGDFNITAFSPDFAMFAAVGLSDSALGRGYPSTFPYRAGRLGLGIDHVLISPGIGVADRWLGPDVNSDHFPLFVELKLPRGR